MNEDDENDITRRLAATLTADDAARVQIMRQVRSGYFRSERDDALDAAIKLQIERMLSPLEARALVVIGESGAGKSRALEWLFDHHATLADYKQPGGILISVTLPGSCTLAVLGRLLLEALGYPLLTEKRENIVWEMSRRRLDSQQVRFVHLDEIQNIITTANVRDAVRIRDELKTFLNTKRKPISLILSGLPEIKPFLEVDTQIRRRSLHVEFTSLTTDHLEMSHEALVGLAEVAQLAVDPGAANTLIPRLMHAALYEMGTMFELIQEAIDNALQTKARTVTATEFAAAYAMRTGSAAPANPFVAPNWHEIDCTVVLNKGDRNQRPADTARPDEPEREEKPRRHKRKKRTDF